MPNQLSTVLATVPQSERNHHYKSFERGSKGLVLTRLGALRPNRRGIQRGEGVLESEPRGPDLFPQSTGQGESTWMAMGRELDG
jgi:hypothetical protein